MGDKQPDKNQSSFTENLKDQLLAFGKWISIRAKAFAAWISLQAGKFHKWSRKKGGEFGEWSGKKKDAVKLARNNRQQRTSAYKPYQYSGLHSRLKRHGRQKVYRLKGYTTVARVNRKRRREYIRRQRNVLIISLLLVLALILIFMWIDPIPRIQSLLHNIGFVTPD